ncbi:MAG: NifU family protein [Acidimicrobiia bacterium]
MSVTPAAHEYLVKLRDEEPDGKLLGVRVEILSDTGIDFTYDLSFQTITKAALDDLVRNHDGLRVIMPSKDAPNLEGSVLDLEDGGLVLRNPNKPKQLEIGNLTRTGSLSERVQQMLDAEINPMLDAHGGFVTYMGHDDVNAVYLMMGGGCQGCSMSRMTMVSGVQTQLKEAIPEITKVIDVTDHTAGSNPYYTG